LISARLASRYVTSYFLSHSAHSKTVSLFIDSTRRLIKNPQSQVWLTNWPLVKGHTSVSNIRFRNCKYSSHCRRISSFDTSFFASTTLGRAHEENCRACYTPCLPTLG